MEEGFVQRVNVEKEDGFLVLRLRRMTGECESGI